jgi:hypothetical protein
MFKLRCPIRGFGCWYGVYLIRRYRASVVQVQAPLAGEALWHDPRCSSTLV